MFIQKVLKTSTSQTVSTGLTVLRVRGLVQTSSFEPRFSSCVGCCSFFYFWGLNDLRSVLSLNAAHQTSSWQTWYAFCIHTMLPCQHKACAQRQVVRPLTTRNIRFQNTKLRDLGQCPGVGLIFRIAALTVPPVSCTEPENAAQISNTAPTEPFLFFMNYGHCFCFVFLLQLVTFSLC